MGCIKKTQQNVSKPTRQDAKRAKESFYMDLKKKTCLEINGADGWK